MTVPFLNGLTVNLSSQIELQSPLPFASFWSSIFNVMWDHVNKTWDNGKRRNTPNAISYCLIINFSHDIWCTCWERYRLNFKQCRQNYPLEIQGCISTTANSLLIIHFLDKTHVLQMSLLVALSGTSMCYFKVCQNCHTCVQTRATLLLCRQCYFKHMISYINHIHIRLYFDMKGVGNLLNLSAIGMNTPIWDGYSGHHPRQ